jgi:hypothetical protein
MFKHSHTFYLQNKHHDAQFYMHFTYPFYFHPLPQHMSRWHSALILALLHFFSLFVIFSLWFLILVCQNCYRWTLLTVRRLLSFTKLITSSVMPIIGSISWCTRSIWHNRRIHSTRRKIATRTWRMFTSGTSTMLGEQQYATMWRNSNGTAWRQVVPILDLHF